MRELNSLEISMVIGGNDVACVLDNSSLAGDSSGGVTGAIQDTISTVVSAEVDRVGAVVDAVEAAWDWLTGN